MLCSTNRSPQHTMLALHNKSILWITFLHLVRLPLLETLPDLPQKRQVHDLYGFHSYISSFSIPSFILFLSHKVIHKFLDLSTNGEYNKKSRQNSYQLATSPTVDKL